MKKVLFTIVSLFLILGSILNCGIFGGDDDKDKDRNNLLLLLGAASLNRGSGSSGRTMYTGFADIPSSLYSTSTGTSSSFLADVKTLATNDYNFISPSNSSNSVDRVYDLVKGTAKTTRDISKSVGDLIQALSTINPTSTITGTDTWGGVASKYRYRQSSKISGGKWLEVWWNTSTSPYSNQKALELNFIDNSASGGSINGFVFARYLNSNQTSLGLAHISFEYTPSTNTRKMAVILTNVNGNSTEKAHFYVQEVNGVTTMDGTYVIPTSSNPSGVTKTRAYVYTASANSSRAVIKAAFPTTTYSTSPGTGTEYNNASSANFGQFWTSYILKSYASTLNNTGLTACNTTNITTADPDADSASVATNISVTNFKSCMDAIISASSSSTLKDIYYIVNVKNPAYFVINGNASKLYAVESLDSTDGNKTVYDALIANLLSAPRTTSATDYKATLDANTVSTMDILNCTGVPANSSISFPSINACWGSGTNGTSVNSTNDSQNNTAPF